MKNFARWLLHMAEVIFLEANGWKRQKPTHGEVYWMPPDNYFWTRKQNEGHNHGHAVNSQKSASYEEGRRRELKEAGLWADPKE